MRFVIMGAGAVGGVIGARLAQHDYDVALIARGEHLVAIQNRGLRIVSPQGEETLSLPATADPTSLDVSANDVVILAVKGQDTEFALRSLAASASSDVAVVCAQNGVANERRALRRFARVYGAVVMCPAGFFEPGSVIAYSSPVTGIIDVGCFPRGSDAVAEELAVTLNRSGFLSRARDDVMRWKYRKLLQNLTNVVEALCGPEARSGRIAELVATEAKACLDAAGIEVVRAEEDRERRGDFLKPQPIGEMSWKPSSSWQSLARHTGTIEVDELNGEIVLLGRLHGIPTPVNELLQRAGHGLARERADPGGLSEERLLAQLD